MSVIVFVGIDVINIYNDNELIRQIENNQVFKNSYTLIKI